MPRCILNTRDYGSQTAYTINYYRLRDAGLLASVRVTSAILTSLQRKFIVYLYSANKLINKKLLLQTILGMYLGLIMPLLQSMTLFKLYNTCIHNLGHTLHNLSYNYSHNCHVLYPPRSCTSMDCIYSILVFPFEILSKCPVMK